MGGLQFVEISEGAGEPLRRERVGRGAAYGDYDNDGDLDLLLTSNGGPAELLRNDTRARYHWLQVELVGVQAFRRSGVQDRSDKGRAGAPGTRPKRGTSGGKGDGARARSNTDPPTAERLNSRTPERLTRSSRNGLGAEVIVTAGGRRQRQWVRSGSSYCSASMRRLHFGLSEATRVERVEVRWPGGAATRLGPVEPDQILTVAEE
jgi:hypothetical protein